MESLSSALPKGQTDYDLVILTAAEIPRNHNVSTSQIVEIVSALRASGTRCIWVAFLPLQAVMGERRMNRDDWGVFETCRSRQIEVFSLVFGLMLFDPRMLWLRSLYGRLGAFLASRKLRSVRLKRRVVINARSYYACEVGVRLAETLRRAGHDVSVCFDMRGLLSLSFPASARRNQFGIYGTLKAWEAQLAASCSSVFNNRKKAIDIFRLEYGVNVVYLPVAGFSMKSVQSVSFEARWRMKKVAFVGSISDKFHDISELYSIFTILRNGGFAPFLVTDSKVPKHIDFPVITVPYAEMPAIYGECLATVLPGRSSPAGFFERMALEVYTGPTKLSESISAGIPVIAGSSLTEICRDLRESKSGIVFDLATHKFADGVDISSRSMWEELAAAAHARRLEFSRERVLEIYRSTWAKGAVAS